MESLFIIRFIIFNNLSVINTSVNKAPINTVSIIIAAIAGVANAPSAISNPDIASKLFINSKIYDIIALSRQWYAAEM